MSLQAAFRSAQSALATNAFQTATVSRNINNADAPGYARRLVLVDPSEIGSFQAARVSRATDHALQGAALDASAVAQSHDAVSKALEALQAIVGNPADQHNGQADHQLGNRTGVGIGRIENHYPVFGGRTQVNLVDTNAKTADRLQFGGRRQHIFSDLRLGTDPENMDVSDFPDQLFFGQGLADLFYIRIIMLPEFTHRRITDIFQKQDAYFFFGIAGFSDARHAANINITVDK